MENKKRALVTGGTRGIGKAIVKELASNGFADVFFVYRSSESVAEELVKELSTDEVNVYAIKADVSLMEDAEKAISEVVEKLGGIDILVNNAGITKDNLLMRMSENDFNDVINVNLNSVFNFSKVAIKTMMRQRYGRIINITSVVGEVGNPGQANYSASKAGVIGFTKSIAKELASRNITVNAVAPGFIETEMTAKLNEKQVEALLANVPVKRMGQPEDVAKLVRFLADDNAGYITGQVLNVDGGMVM